MSAEVQNKIKEIGEALTEMLIEKNKRYGNSALDPSNVFYKGGSTSSICIRIDDKLSRIKNNNGEPKLNDVADLIGYLILYLVDMGWTKKEILSLID